MGRASGRKWRKRAETLAGRDAESVARRLRLFGQRPKFMRAADRARAVAGGR